MRKFYLVLLTILLAITTRAQDNASSLKLIFNADGSISPPYILPLGQTETGVLELADNSVHLFNIMINPWGTFMFGYPGGGDHATKFRFINSSDIGIDSGLVLGTGRLNSDSFFFGDEYMGIAWPVTYNSTGYNPGGISYGDIDPSRFTQYPDLVALNDGDSMIDAVIVEFDFVAQGSTMLLDYVFASEEYPENIIKSPNDQMAIFLSKPGVPGYQNIATIPGTTVPVGISTINPTINAEWYVDNLGNNGQNVIFDGFTTVLTASANVIPCDTYHLRLAVADGARHDNDTLWWISGGRTTMYDSGLFLKAGSLRSVDSIWVSALGGAAADTATPYAVRDCLPGTFRIQRATQSTTPLTVSYQLSGSATAGTDYTPLSGSVTIPPMSSYVDVPVTALSGGTGNVALTLTPVSSTNACATVPAAFVSAATLEIKDLPQASIVTSDTVICIGCSAQIVVQGDMALQYQWTPATGLSDAGIAMPLATPQQSTLYHMQATYNNCPPAQDSLMIWVGDVGIEERMAKSGISMYPNPFSTSFQIKTEQPHRKLQVQLYDPVGKLLLETSGSLEDVNRQLSQSQHLAAGNYLLQVIADGGKPVVFKLSKTQ